MVARFRVSKGTTSTELAATPLGRVIAYANRTSTPIRCDHGYPGHNGDWWQPVSWNPVDVEVKP